jgi:hypothetical protein
LSNIALPLFEAFNTFIQSDIVSEVCILQIKINKQTWHRKSETKRKTLFYSVKEEEDSDDKLEVAHKPA